jgi:hypothetical protein
MADLIGHLMRDTKYRHFDKNSRPMDLGVWRLWQGIQSGLTSCGRQRMQYRVLLRSLYQLESVEETSAYIISCILCVRAVRCHSSCMEDTRAIEYPVPVL